MQLTSILLYENLKKKFHIAEYRLLSKNQPLARPFFYEADRGLQSNHIYLTTEILDLELFHSMPEDVIFVICQKSETSVLPKGKFSCILLSSDTSAIHVFNFIQSIFDYYEEWEKQLVSICQQDGSLTDLLDASRKVFQNPLRITDMDFSLTAQSGLSQIPEEFDIFQDSARRMEYLNAFLQDESCQTSPEETAPVLFPEYISGHRSLNINLFLENQAKYHLSIIECESSLSESDWYLITILAHHAEYIVHRMHSESSSRSTTLQSIFQSVLSDRTADYMNISHLLEHVEWLPEHTYLCSVILTSGPGHYSLNDNTICQYISSDFPASCSIVFKEHVVSFYNLTLLAMEPEDVFQSLVYFIRDSMLKAGYSRPMTGHMNLRRQYLQALTALTMGCEIQPQLWIHHFSQIAMPYILKQATKVFPGYMICYEKLLDLQKSDATQNTEYMKTLRVYLDHNLNTVQSAKALFIHRSTFLYRLERIKAILETDLEDPEELFYLNLSFRLLDMDNL